MTDKGESAAVTEMDVEIEMTDEEKMKEIENYLLGYGPKAFENGPI